jgi:hypothetical protein
MAHYLPSSDALTLSGYTGDGELSFTLSQDAPIIGTQDISSVSLFNDLDQCMFQASDVPALVIDTAGAEDLSEGPIVGSFSATLPEITGACGSESIDINGTFQAAVCAN